MSACLGRVECEIYRDKKYCRTREGKEDYYGRCDCRHAKKLCEVGNCSFYDLCKRGRAEFAEQFQMFAKGVKK